MFKNETHNHPTEIEPFGGAATCLGGAIRDPLSGRSYVYQAMRVTGAGDPTRTAVSRPSNTSCRSASCARPRRRATPPMATRLALLPASCTRFTIRVMLQSAWRSARLSAQLRWRTSSARYPSRATSSSCSAASTGRDGCGGATGSSKKHTEESLETCGAEVQKGNPPEERKIQRLFRDGECHPHDPPLQRLRRGRRIRRHRRAG